jgi:hypothetical protein
VGGEDGDVQRADGGGDMGGGTGLVVAAADAEKRDHDKGQEEEAAKAHRNVRLLSH